MFILNVMNKCFYVHLILNRHSLMWFKTTMWQHPSPQVYKARPWGTLPVAPAPQLILHCFQKVGLQLICSGQGANAHCKWAKSFNTVYIKVSLACRKLLGHCRSHRYQVDIPHLWGILSGFTEISVFYIYTLPWFSTFYAYMLIVFYSVDAICNSGRTNTEPGPEIGTRMLTKCLLTRLVLSDTSWHWTMLFQSVQLYVF